MSLNHQTLEQHQQVMGMHLRDPDNIPAPNNLDDRRLSIYRELVFNNIESQLSGAFPVINRILSHSKWNSLVREFLRDFRAKTPYFTQLSAEFVSFLSQRAAQKDDFIFLVELAHYERIELDLYMMNEACEIKTIDENNLLTTSLFLAKTTRILAYNYPVQSICPDFLPTEAPQNPTLLLLFQDKQGEVRFFEVQMLAYQLLTLLSEQQGTTGLNLLERIAKDLKLEISPLFFQQGTQLLKQLNSLNVLRISNDT